MAHRRRLEFNRGLDALAAYVVDVATPWPEFFMLELFGRTMFFAAAAMHLVIIGLLLRLDVRHHYGIASPSREVLPTA